MEIIFVVIIITVDILEAEIPEVDMIAIEIPGVDIMEILEVEIDMMKIEIPGVELLLQRVDHLLVAETPEAEILLNKPCTKIL